MTMQTFLKKCTRNGFTVKGLCAFRCIGDGVYQTIRLNELCFVDPASPYYNSRNRRSRRIAIGLYSIYAKLPSNWFNPQFGAGTIDARNLIGQPDSPFWGLQDHVDIMEKTGFKMLGEIYNHQALICFLESMGIFDASLLLTKEMCTVYLICGEVEKARNIINFRLNDKHFIRWCTEVGNDGHKKRQQELNDWLSLERYTQKNDNIDEYLHENMKNNIKLAEHYGVFQRGDFEPKY